MEPDSPNSSLSSATSCTSSESDNSDKVLGQLEGEKATNKKLTWHVLKLNTKAAKLQAEIEVHKRVAKEEEKSEKQFESFSSKASCYKCKVGCNQFVA